jgi:hypothetical protein
MAPVSIMLTTGQEMPSALSCRRLCSKHPNYVPVKKIDYAKGMKVCITCDRAVFIGMAGSKCPCCNKNLRTRPQYHGDRGRMVR